MQRSKINFSRCVAFSLVVLSFVSCGVRRPDDVMDDEQMENVLVDYHIAKAMGDELPNDQAYKRVLYMESVFQKHGINKAIFDSSMVWYARNTASISKLYEEVNRRLKAQRDGINHLIALRSNKPQEQVSGDSLDLWVWARRQQLSGMPMDNLIQFEITSDTTFYDRDRLVFNARFRFPEGNPDSAYAPVMALQMNYRTDSTTLLQHRVMREGWQHLRVGADSLGQLRDVRGFIYYPRQKNTVRRATVSIDDISLMRYHSSDSVAVMSQPSSQHILKRQ